jgi:hypothetical protein
MRRIALVAFAALGFAACSPKHDIRTKALQRALAPTVMAQAERIARLSDAEVRDELARPITRQPPEARQSDDRRRVSGPARDRPGAGLLKRWFATLDCNQKPTPEARNACRLAAAENAKRGLRPVATPGLLAGPMRV